MTTAGCSSLFLQEPTSWMVDKQRSFDVYEAEGKILCYKCQKRVGSFCWSGSQCSCGTWVVPSLQIPRSKVDVRRVRSEKLPPEALIPTAEEEVDALEEETEKSRQSEDPEKADDICAQNEHSEVDLMANRAPLEKLKQSSAHLLSYHHQWLSLIHSGAEHSCLSFDDKKSEKLQDLLFKNYISLETVSGKQIEDREKIIAMQEKLAGRISILHEPTFEAEFLTFLQDAEMQAAKATSSETELQDEEQSPTPTLQLPPAIATICTFSIMPSKLLQEEQRPVGMIIKETLWWNTNTQRIVQIIRQRKKPTAP